MVPGAADVQAEINPTPVTGIGGIEFRKEIGQLIAGNS